MLVALSYTLIFTPYSVAFIDNLNQYPIYYYLDMIIDIFFLIDIIITFFSAYYNLEDEICVQHKLIAINYITGWFLIDFIGIFPF